MRRKAKTFKKIASVLAEIGCELKIDGTLYSFQKDYIDYLVDVDEEEEIFCLIERVVGLKGELTKEQFDIAIDVIKHFHIDYDGDWNDGKSYITSPTYCLNRFKVIPKNQMEEIIKDFFEVFTFMCANACMLTDDTISWQSP